MNKHVRAQDLTQALNSWGAHGVYRCIHLLYGIVRSPPPVHDCQQEYNRAQNLECGDVVRYVQQSVLLAKHVLQSRIENANVSANQLFFVVGRPNELITANILRKILLSPRVVCTTATTADERGKKKEGRPREFPSPAMVKDIPSGGWSTLHLS